MFLERALRGGRHVEVQVVADATGDVWTLGVRDCSVQRRNQKVIEESASLALDAEQEELLRASAARLVRARRATSTPAPSSSSTSRASGAVVPRGQHAPAGRAPGHRGDDRLDIVKLQLHVAMGGRLADFAAAPPAPYGHAIEARLTAEDPEHDFAPAART